MGTRSKRHHFVPQLILEGFALDGQIGTLDLGSRKAYIQSVRTAAAENNYNTVELEGGAKSDAAERAIAEAIEGPAAGVVRNIVSGGWIGCDDERVALARLIALQFLRVPAQREQRDAMADLLAKLQLAAGGPNQLREVLRATEGREVSDEEVLEAWKQLRDFDEWQVKQSQDQHVAETLTLTDEFFPGLIELYDWAVVRWQRKHLLTSDVPLLLVPMSDWPAWRGVGLYTAGTLCFPLSRTTSLMLVHRARGQNVDGLELVPTAAKARSINRGLVHMARERVFHHPEDELEDLVGHDFDLPTPEAISYADDHNSKLIESLRQMGEWHFENPDQPHPMAGAPEVSPPEGAEPWRGTY
jgi:hypothetical protein